MAAIRHHPQGSDLLVVGYLNIYLAAPEGHDQDKTIAAAMVKYGLEDMVEHFLHHHRLWMRDVRMWIMLHIRHKVISQTDYILSKDRRLFQNVSIQDTKQNTDHYLVLG